jgi:small GTP-binding protein
MVCNQNTVECAIVGDGMVGKTAITNRFTENQFSDEYVATVSEKSWGSVTAYGDKYTVNINEVNIGTSY